MKKHLLPLALLLVPLLPARPAHAEDADPETRPKVLELSRATVLASPGTPTALETFLPHGTKPRKLSWPLPAEGSLLVLGLPESDPVARRLADLFQFDVEADTLAGGYAVHAWQDGRRNLVFVFAADAAALHAARFEFDATASIEMMDPNMRSLDFKKPNQEAGLQVLAGNRVVRPRYRMRALAPGADLPEDTAIGVSGARGNRLWIDASTEEARARRQIRLARAHGIEPVVVLSKPCVSEALPEALKADARPWLRDASLRHFALEFDVDIVEVLSLGKRYAKWEARYAADLARVLRARGALEELVVIPRCYSDRLAKAYGPPPDLSDIPEAVIAWSGPREHTARILREKAEQRAKAAGVPVVLLDTWAAPFQEAPARDLYIPSLPTGRAPDLGDVLAGIVVVGAHGTEALLESAWDGEATERFGLDLLGEFVPRDEEDPLEVARGAAVRLEHAAKENLGLVPWMAPLAAELRRLKIPLERIPLVKLPVWNDGRLHEKAWSAALHVPETPRGVELHLFSDGSALHVGMHIDRQGLDQASFPIRLRITPGKRGPAWRFEITKDGFSFERPGASKPDLGADPVVQLSRGRVPKFDEVEITLDRFALGGDAHELRSYELDLSTLHVSRLPPPFRKTATLIVLK